MRGVHTDNETAKSATQGRRTAISEEKAIRRAYAKDKRLCLHMRYPRFRGIVRTLAQQNDISVAAAAASWVARWSQRTDRLPTITPKAPAHARDTVETKPAKSVRTLPNGQRVFYGS
jgi:hypothetical protein